MALGFPAYATRKVQVNADQMQLAEAIPAALNALHWSFYEISPTSFGASLSIGLFSWGERVTIDFSDPSWIQVTSKCSFPLQLVDWGKNDTNVRKFLDQLLSLLQSPGVPRL